MQIEDLYAMQSLPTEIKVQMTKKRIIQWVEHYGLDHVYLSFSGGKDSTVLLTIARQCYPDMLAVFFDTGLEYPEIRNFVKTFDNVEWIRPKMTFRQVIEKYGYPFISKEVSDKVYGARKYVKALNSTEREADTSVCSVRGGSVRNRQKKEQTESSVSGTKKRGYP